MTILLWVLAAILALDTLFLIGLSKNPLKGRAKKGEIK
ncbi:hypothetical protein J2T13_000819 [Paenibacillus sp. DS2015]